MTTAAELPMSYEFRAGQDKGQRRIRSRRARPPPGSAPAERNAG
jgi:hypothetical protein